MVVAGLCVHCGKPAIRSCPLCGRVVCGECFDPVRGACNGCRGANGDPAQRPKPLGMDADDGGLDG